MTEQELVEDKMTDVPPMYHEVVRKFGREMYTHLMLMAMAQQGLQILGGIAEKHRSTKSQQAIAVLVQVINTMAPELARLKGFTPERLKECDQALRAATGPQIVMPEPGALIVPH